MNFDELLGYEQADIAEEVIGALGEPLEEGEDLPAELVEFGRPGVEVEDLLLEPAPELLDRVEPGGVGRQADQLEGQVQAARLGRRRRGGPRGARPGPGPR